MGTTNARGLWPDGYRLMDLGIQDRRALVCASTRGLGYACAEALAREGCDVLINGHDRERLDSAVDALRATGCQVSGIFADLNRPEERKRLLDAAGEVDILVNNNAGPPPGHYQKWQSADWYSALESNMLGAVQLIQGLVPGMCERKFGRVVNITSAMVKSPRAPMGLSTAARSGLTAYCKGLSQEVAADNVTINNLLPERFNTDRQRYRATRMRETSGITMEAAMQQIAETISAKRLGDPVEFGDTCAFLCSRQAGYLSGQNIQLDGGSYPGLI
jgi:3-oxoacyl-[acyl-carrier protein] reductase